MLKQLTEYINKKKVEREEKKRKEEMLDKTYPRDYLFYGTYDMKVIERDLEYAYSCSEVFLANDKIKPTAFKRMTGYNLEGSSVEILSSKANKYDTRMVCYDIEDNGIRYRVNIHSSNSMDESWLNNHDISHREIIRRVNIGNMERRDDARKSAERRLSVDKEFTN